MKKLSIVIPVHNEKVTIKKVLENVLKVSLPPNWTKEVIVVDDGSTDGTRAILEQLKHTVTIITREKNGGKGAALKDGFKAVTGDYVLLQDADLEYNPAEYQKLLKPIDMGEAQVVFGSRALGKNNVSYSKIYYYGGRLVTKIFNFCFKRKLTDITTCYKVFPKQIIAKLIKQPANDFVFDAIQLTHVLLQEGKIVEVPISYTPRSEAEGKKLSWQDGLLCIWEISKLTWGIKIREIGSLLKDTFNFIKNYLETHTLTRIAVVYSFFVIIFSLVYFSVVPLASSDDHYFHFRFAQLMLQNGFLYSFRNFHSIYFSKITTGQYFVYYNFLFYIVILPLTYIQPLYLAIKLYAILAAALGFTILYATVRGLKVRYAFIWTLAFIGIINAAAIYRFFLSRPYTLAPALLISLVYFLYKKNRVAAFIVSFIYLYWHSLTFFFPLFVGIIYYVIEKLYRQKADWKNLVAVFAGVGAALVTVYIIAPGFLTYAKDIVFGIYWETLVSKKVVLPEGGEVYPIAFFNYIQSNVLFFSSFIVAICYELYVYVSHRKKFILDAFTTVEPLIIVRSTVFCISLGLFAGTIIVSGRFGDYFVFFASVYLILALSDLFHQFTIANVQLKKVLFGALLITVVYLFGSNILSIQASFAQGSSPDLFQGAGTWLSTHTNKGDIVFNPNWGWFPQLYYYSPYNNYVAGLEPRFMYVYNSKLYWLWFNIGSYDYVCDTQDCSAVTAIETKFTAHQKNLQPWYTLNGDAIAKVLLNDFHSQYIVTTTENSNLNAIMDHNPHFIQVYKDNRDIFIYRVIAFK